MSALLDRLFEAGIALSDRQPLLALLLGGAFLCVLLKTFLRPGTASGTGWGAYAQATRLLWAVFLTVLVTLAVSTLRNHLHDATLQFRSTHGKVTEVNLQAVRTIWGTEQHQRELQAALTYEEKTTQRLTSEDPTQPALLRETTAKKSIPNNPFLQAHHEITLTQNPRRKGSAVYPGYETACVFTYRLKNPADRQVRGAFSLPLPASSAVLDGLDVQMNGASVLDKLQMADGAMLLEKDLNPGETAALRIAFRSRGLAEWYFQIQELREIRDFSLTLRLPDLPRSALNYPEGCMPPTAVEDAAQGCVLSWKLDHAISRKGMGINLPRPEQPGELATKLLGNFEVAWVLLFSFLLVGTALSDAPYFPLTAVGLGALWALGFGLLSSLHDTALGPWGSLALSLLGPLLLTRSMTQRMPGKPRGLMLGVLVFGVAEPLLASLDPVREELFLQLSVLVFLLLAGGLYLKRDARA